MSNSKMLIDASHPEETRVVVLKGSRIEEFDFESASKRQLRGNIYLAKVTRVEPSLQAAFVEYGGNRHGFLAFSEIHPDYYQIPFADRQALLEEEARAHRDEEEEPREPRRGRGGGEGARRDGEDRGEREGRGGRGERGQRRSRRHRRDAAPATALDRRGPADDSVSEPAFDVEQVAELAGADVSVAEGAVEVAAEDAEAPAAALEGAPPDAAPAEEATAFAGGEVSPPPEAVAAEAPEPVEVVEAAEIVAEVPQMHLAPPAAEMVEDEPEAVPQDAEAEAGGDAAETGAAEVRGEADPVEARAPGEARDLDLRAPEGDAAEPEEEHVEQIGGDALSDVAPRPVRPRRHYKIQEVIKRRQILLIQVVKEERGNKGAALTTYLSLAGRYSVLMPNTAKGGGISRKITDGEDRKRLKAIAGELDVPEGMGVILRTAGASRSPVEVRRDFEYLLRMWESVRELTLKSSAPTLVYEEGSLIKRTIRDLYSQDIGEILVSGEAGFGEARDFMRMLMPGLAATVQPYRDAAPIFAKSGVEAQLDAMFSSHVTLKSGGYLVINQTEALVAIDVNSGRSTREHNIEDTALRTNLEAADEVARQLRLRDLAGLIVVDFIDMEEGRNNRAVERRLKDALKNDRARIQIGRISHFGLLEMSRQRMRTGVLEGSTVVCPHCAGTGTVRSTSSIALHVLRLVEDALIRDSAYDLVVRSRAEVALYMLNQKRAKLVELEQRFGVTVTVSADPTLTGMVYHAIERGEPATRAEAPAPRPDLVRVDSIAPVFEPEDEEGAAEDEAADAGRAAADGAPAETGEGDRRRRKRRRRRGGRDRDGGGEASVEAPQPSDAPLADPAEFDAAPEVLPAIGFSAEPSGPDEVGTDEVEAEIPAGPVRGEADAPDEAVPADGASGEEAPKRRRSRRAAPRAAEPEAGEAEPAAEEAPKRRRSRRAAPRVPDAEISDAGPEIAPAEAEPVGARPSADRDVGADTVEHHAEEAAPPLPVAAESTVDTMAAVADAEAEAEAEAEASTPAEPERPKRSGWWQRAKSSFGA